jgi:hypothetical protein
MPTRFKSASSCLLVNHVSTTNVTPARALGASLKTCSFAFVFINLVALRRWNRGKPVCLEMSSVVGRGVSQSSVTVADAATVNTG